MEIDLDAIAREAQAEVEAEAAGKEVPPSKGTQDADPDPEKKQADEKDPDDDGKQADDDDGQQDDDEGKKSEDAGSDEDAEAKAAALAERAQKLGLNEEATEEEITAAEKKAEEDEFEKAALDMAKEEDISPLKAKEILKGRKGLVEKYKGEPLAMAKALQSMQSAWEKDKQQLREYASRKPEIVLTDDEISIEGKVFNKAEVIEAYREKEGDLTEEMMDDAVLKLALKDLQLDVQRVRKEENEALSAKAEERKQEFLGKLTGKDKEYRPEVDKLLQKYPPRSILEMKDPDFEDLLFWAKGKQADEREQAAYERGLQKGKESSKPKLPPVGGGSGGGKHSVRGLTDTDKEDARQMFASLDTEEEMYEAYLELKRDGTFKKD